MSDHNATEPTRRDFLYIATGAMGAVGAAALAWPFIDQLNPDAASLALATDGFNRLFSNDNPALRLARDIGLAAVNAWPGLRRSLIREAAGLTGDLPRLLQGHPL